MTRGCHVPPEIRSLLKRERVESGMSLREASRQIGIGEGRLRDLENGHGREGARYETIMLWAALFQYEISITVTKREF